MMEIADLLSPPNDGAVQAALDGYAALVREAYGDRLAGLYLFGSRARGTPRPDSDADVAVVLSSFSGSALDEKMRLVDLAFDALTEAGLMIQPWPFTRVEWAADAPQGRFAGLLGAAKRDALMLAPAR